jgi:hypothetical protein
VDHLVKQWKPNKPKGSPLQPREFTIDPKSRLFSDKYDKIQEDLELITGKPSPSSELVPVH